MLKMVKMNSKPVANSNLLRVRGLRLLKIRCIWMIVEENGNYFQLGEFKSCTELLRQKVNNIDLKNDLNISRPTLLTKLI